MDKDSHLLFEAAYSSKLTTKDFEGNPLKIGDEVEFKTKKPDFTVSSGKITNIRGNVIDVMVSDEYRYLHYKMYGEDALINNTREDKMSHGYGADEDIGFAQYVGMKIRRDENAEETDDQEYEDELDKKEAYKANLLRGGEDEDAEERALDAIGDKRVTKEQARQIADKYTNWSHEELIKTSSAYNNGFNHELQGIADDNEYKDGTLNYYMYEFGQYEALTSH